MTTLHFRVDSNNGIHLHLTVFIDGKNCGHLCLGAEDWDDFREFIMHNHPTIGVEISHPLKP